MELSKAKLMHATYTKKYLLSLESKYSKQPFRVSELTQQGEVKAQTLPVQTV